MKQSLQFLHRKLALLFTVILLVSLMLPAAASAEGIVSGELPSLEQVQDSGSTAGGVGDSASGGAVEFLEDGTPTDDPVSKSTPGQSPDVPDVPLAQNDNSPEQQATPSEQSNGQSDIVSVSPSSSSSGGAISSANVASSSGTSDEGSGTTEYFVASYGSDSYDGSPEAPFASLSHACAVAADVGADTVVLLLLTDLECDETLSFYGKHFVLTSENAPCTVTRADEFKSDDGEEDSLIIIGDSARYRDDGENTELVLEYITLDDSKGIDAGGTVIEVCDGARLVVGEDASVLGRDSMVSIHGDPEAEIHAYEGAHIYGGTPILEEDGCLVTLEDGADVPDYMSQEEDGKEEENGRLDEDEDKEYDEGSITGEIDDVDTQETNSETVEDENAAGDVNLGSVEQGDIPFNELSLQQDTPSSGADGQQDNLQSIVGNSDGIGDKKVSDRQSNQPTAVNEDAPGGTTDAEQLKASAGTLSTASQIYAADAPVFTAQAPTLAAASDPDGFSLLAPESISIDDPHTEKLHTDIPGGDLEGYLIPYTIVFKIPDSLSTLAPDGFLVIQDMTVNLTLSLPADVHPEVEGLADVVISPKFHVFDVTSASFIGNTISVTLQKNSNWATYSSELSSPLRLQVQTILPAAQFVMNQTLIAEAAIDGQYTTTWNSSPSSLPSIDPVTASTELLGPKTASLLYDPNGGTFDSSVTGSAASQAPIERKVSPSNSCMLDSSLVPIHEDFSASPVLFYGWSTTKDTTIYSSSDSRPAIVDHVAVAEGARKTVFAVYSYDVNEDNVPDVDQALLVLTYDANGGNNAPPPQYAVSNILGNAHMDIAEQEPTRRYYGFLGWAKTSDATEAEYRFNKSVNGLDDDLTISENTTLYAVWEENPSYTLSFSANGGRNAPSSVSARSEYVGDILVAYPQIPSGKPTRSGAEFIGWAEAADATEPMYDPGEVVPIEENTTLYAVWARYYTLYFNGTGASDAPDPITALAADGVASMTIPDKTPTRNRYDFQGWSPTRYGSASFSPGEDVKLTGGDVTLYAVWKRNTSTSSSSTTADGKAPRTGDESNTALYATLAIVSAAALSAGVYILKKNRS